MAFTIATSRFEMEVLPPTLARVMLARSLIAPIAFLSLLGAICVFLPFDLDRVINCDDMCYSVLIEPASINPVAEILLMCVFAIIVVVVRGCRNEEESSFNVSKCRNSAGTEGWQ